jgi:hypothetical protein
MQVEPVEEYRAFLNSKECGRFKVVQSQTYLCVKYSLDRIKGETVFGNNGFDMSIEDEIQGWLPYTRDFERLDVQPPVDIGFLPDSVNEIIREYAVDDYPKAYKKRRRSLRQISRDPIQTNHW